MKLFIFFCILLLPVYINGQIIFIDQETQQSIPYVYTLDSTGKVIGVSDISGKIQDMSFLKSNIIECVHIAYNSIKVNIDTLRQAKIYMLARNIQLNDIVISSKKPDYLVLKGYFRSYQLDDKIPKAFSDGIIEYYIPLNKPKRLLKYALTENRTYRNTTLYKNKHYQTASGDRTGAPYIDKKSILKMHPNYKVIDSTNIYKKILFKNGNTGQIKIDSINHDTEISVTLTSYINAYEHKFKGINTKFISYLVTELYDNQTNTNNNKSKLTMRYEYRKQIISSKKLKSAITVESIHEFYVLERKFISKKELPPNLINYFGPFKTNYKSDYWHKAFSIGVNKTPQYIKKILGNTLKVY